MKSQKLFDSANEAFYEHGVQTSDLSESVSRTQVEGWFESYNDTPENGQVYWITAPFVFAEVVFNNEKVEYSIIEPNYSEEDESVVKYILEETEISISSESFEAVAEECNNVYDDEDKYEVDGYKLLYNLLKNDSIYGTLYPLSVDEYVTSLTASAVDSVLVTIRKPSFKNNVPTNVAFDSLGEFNNLYNNLERYTDEVVNGFSMGYRDSGKTQIRLAPSTGRGVITLSFYDSQSLSLPELVGEGTINKNMAAYLWLVSENDVSTLVVGGQNCGKTTLLRSMMEVMEPTTSVAAVGSGRELDVERDFLQYYSRDELSESGEEIKFISNMLPSCLIVDDMTPNESEYVLDAIDSGKTAWASLTSHSINSTIKTLTSEPYSLIGQKVSQFDVVVVMNQINTYDAEIGGVKTSHRVETIGEFEKQEEGFRISEAYYRDPERDEFVEDIEMSRTLEQIRMQNGWTVDRLHNEIKSRGDIVMALSNVDASKDTVRFVLNAYHSDKETVSEQAEAILSGDTESFDL